MKTFFSICLLITLSIVFSCKKEKVDSIIPTTPEYSVPADFTVFVQRFIDEANKRGQSFDFHKSGLIIEFADNKDENWAGRCHYEVPRRIEIDKETWNNYGQNSYDGNLLQEEVIFHELGHGFINNRGHKNETFTYGDWVSMMRGGNGAPPPDGRKSFNMNYRGMRRSYYLDELFTPSTPAPKWASEQANTNDNPNQNIIFHDDFNSNNVNNWPEGKFSDCNMSLSGNVYDITTTGTNGYYFAKEISIDTSKNFYIEVNIKYSTTDTTDFCGLVWGGSSGKDLYYFGYTTKQNIIIGNYTNYGYYIDIPCKVINQNNYNKLSIRKMNNLFYLFVNDTYVYSTDYNGFFGGKTGFHVSGNSSVSVSKLQVSYLGSVAKSKSELQSLVSKTTYMHSIPKIKNLSN